MILDDEQIRRVLASDGYPVVKIIRRDRDGIHYSVVCGGEGGSDFENARGIWDRFVEFSAGNTTRGAAHRAGGPAFVDAAREQDRIAELVLLILHEHGR